MSVKVFRERGIVMKRFLVCIATVIVFAGDVWAGTKSGGEYVINPFQIHGLLGRGTNVSDGINTEELWHSTSFKLIGGKVKNFFYTMAEYADIKSMTMPGDISLSLIANRLGFLSYDTNDSVFDALTQDENTFFDEYKKEASDQKYKHAIVSKIIKSQNNKISCADVYRAMGELLESYFAKTFDRINKYNEDSYEHPVIHIFMQRLEDSSIQMVSLPLAPQQNVYKGYEKELEQVLNEKNKSSWVKEGLKVCGGAVLVYLTIYSAKNKFPPEVRKKIVNALCNSFMPNEPLNGICLESLPLIFDSFQAKETDPRVLEKNGGMPTPTPLPGTQNTTGKGFKKGGESDQLEMLLLASKKSLEACRIGIEKVEGASTPIIIATRNIERFSQKLKNLETFKNEMQGEFNVEKLINLQIDAKALFEKIVYLEDVICNL